MEQRPSVEANWFSVSQEIPHILWNPKVHYYIYKCPPPIHAPSRIDPIHASKSHFLKILLNITNPPTPGSSKWSLPRMFPHQTSPLSHMCYIDRPSHSSQFDQSKNI